MNNEVDNTKLLDQIKQLWKDARTQLEIRTKLATGHMDKDEREEKEVECKELTLNRDPNDLC